MDGIGQKDIFKETIGKHGNNGLKTLDSLLLFYH